MKGKIFLVVSFFALALFSQRQVQGQTSTQGPRRPGPVSGTANIPQLAHLPDLIIQSVEFASGSTPETSEKSKIAIVITNQGDKGFATANIKGPIQVWLRVWKPAAAQSRAETEPKATTFTWGGVAKLDDLAAGESKSVFIEAPKPPGGWETTGGGGVAFIAYPRMWKTPNDPLRLRVVARVDSNNAVKEMDESNNDRFLFERPPTGTGPLLSIKTVQQPANEPVIKVLVENLGTQMNSPGAKLKFQLEESVKQGSVETNVDVFFWVPGKPTPHGDGTWMGLGPKKTPLTQTDIDALPATTKIPQKFEKSLLIPTLAPGASTWLTVDFTLPDPGTYVRPNQTFPGLNPLIATSRPGYITALTPGDECANLKAFYASHPRLAIRIEQKKSYSLAGAQSSYHGQLSPSFFKFVNYSPPNKYVGCK